MSKRKTLAEQAKELGISISTLKRQRQQKRKEEAAKKAKNEIFNFGTQINPFGGFNPRGGNRKRV